MNATITNKIFLWISIFSLIVIEIFCAKLAFATIGEITSSLYFLVIAINLLPVILLMIQKHERLAVLVILLIGFIVVPYQLFLGNKLLTLKEEAANITAYVYEQKIQTGNYPQDLSNYNFAYPNTRKNFNYNLDTDNQFSLYYYVGTESTSHSYSSKTKKWGYYPD